MSQAKQTEKTTCYHCGEDCIDQTLVHDNHSFCCQGCKAVYTLLNDTGLISYYEIDEKTPGKTVKEDHSSKDFLDLEEVQNRYFDFKEGRQRKVTFYLPSMHCAACIWLLERLEQINNGVVKSEVNFLRKELTVFFHCDQISLKELVILLEKLGYPPDLQRDLSHQNKKNPEQRKLLLKLGVAGFAFGNIMLFSFPDYLSLEDASLDSFKPLFSFLNLLLAMPVLVYSAMDYLKSAWKSIRIGYLTIDVPIALGIIALFGRSAYEVLSSTGAGYFDSFAGLIFFLLIGKWYQGRTYEALAFDRDFKSYFPIAVTRIKNQQEEVCMLEEIEVGNRIKLLNNQVIPADSILIKGIANIDYSFVNGESDIIEKHEGDVLHAGGRQTAGSIEIEVVKNVSHSYLTGLWNQEVFNNNDEQRFSGLIDKVSRYFSVAILSIAFLTLGLRWWFELGETFNAFTAVLIIACPCALALSMPFAMGNVSRILGKLGFFVKNARTLEKMASLDTVVFDKTGTLTNATRSKVLFNGPALSENQMVLVRSAAASSTHPLSVAIKTSLPALSTSAPDFYEELAGLGLKARIGESEVALGSAQMAKTLSKKEESTFNTSVVHLWIDGKHLGYFTIEKEVREGIPELVKQLQLRFETHLLSGDNDSEMKRMKSIFGEKSKLWFKQSPMDKLHYVAQVQQNGRSVLMLGDGLNDAGALKEANVGIA
ncbi:MAG: heavy metal translocating P-type ATPase metal-binding domain-containing protein, partial [Salibacteraceae bacterium]